MAKKHKIYKFKQKKGILKTYKDFEISFFIEFLNAENIRYKKFYFQKSHYYYIVIL